MKPPPPVLPADLLALMRRGVSVIVGSRDRGHRPSLMRALGSQVAVDGSAVTVFLSQRQAAPLLADLQAGGPIAVVFSEPSTHRTIQLKASATEARRATPQDEPALQAYLLSMERELALVGIAAPMTRAMLSYALDDLVAVGFQPEQAFDQTPGPRAGLALYRTGRTA